MALPPDPTYPCLALTLLTSMVVMECLAPDCTSHSTFHWGLLDLVCSRFTPFLAFTLRDRKETKRKREKDESVLWQRMICAWGQRSVASC